MVGDPFATLVRVGNVVSLALLKSTFIEAHGVRVDAVNGRDLNRAAAKIAISGQIYDMKIGPSSTGVSPSEVSGSNGDDPVAFSESSEHDGFDTPYSWIWTGGFARLDSGGTNSSSAPPARKTVELAKISGVLCEPVNPRALNVNECDIYSPELVDGLRRLNGTTWEFVDGELSFLIDHLWRRVKDNNLVNHLHRLRATSMFPYRDASNGVLSHILFFS